MVIVVELTMKKPKPSHGQLGVLGGKMKGFVPMHSYRSTNIPRGRKKKTLEKSP
jgi:hypothetical protein